MQRKLNKTYCRKLLRRSNISKLTRGVKGGFPGKPTDLLDDGHPDVLAQHEVEDRVDDGVDEGEEEEGDAHPVHDGAEEGLQVELEEELHHEARAPAHQEQQHHADQHLDHLEKTSLMDVLHSINGT